MKEFRRPKSKLKKIVENQRKTLEELKKFKQKLDGYAHLGDIDKIWGDCQKWHQDMESLTKEISVATEHSQNSIKRIEAIKTALTSAEKKTEDLSTHFSQMIERMESVTAFANALEEITHLQDIDEMWESLATAHSSLKNIGSTIEVLQKGSSKHQEEINKILAYVEEVSSLEHLMDVDKLWSYVEEQKFHLKEINRISGEQVCKLGTIAQKNDEISERVSANEQNFINLNKSIIKINSMAHLEDVDRTWDTVNEHSKQLTEMEKQSEVIATDLQKNKEDVEVKTAEVDNAIISLTQKIKYAYLIAGGAAGLAIIELILLLMIR